MREKKSKKIKIIDIEVFFKLFNKRQNEKNVLSFFLIFDCIESFFKKKTHASDINTYTLKTKK